MVSPEGAQAGGRASPPQACTNWQPRGSGPSWTSNTLPRRPPVRMC